MKPIKNATTYTAEITKAFLEVYFFEKIRVVRFIVNLIAIFSIIMFFNENKYIHIDLFMLILSLICLIEVNTNMIPWLNYKKLLRNKDSLLNTSLDYTFKKNNFKYGSKDNYIDYSALKKVVETNKAYYLYIDASKVLVVDKNTLSAKEIDTLTTIFKEKVTTYRYKKHV